MNNENNDLTNIFPSQGSDGNAVGNNMDNTNAINSNVESMTNENPTNEQPIDLMGPLATEINNTVQENPVPQAPVMETQNSMASQPVDNMAQTMEVPNSMASQSVDNMAQTMEAPNSMASQPVDNMAQTMEVPNNMASQPIDNMAQTMEVPNSMASQPVDNMAQTMEVPNSMASQPVNNMASPEVSPSFQQPINNAMPNPGSQVPPVMNQNINMNPIPPMGNVMNQGNKGGFMSKYGKFIFIVLALVVVGAALYMIMGGKKLTCTKKQDEMGMNMDASITFKFASDKAKSAHAEMTLTLPDEYKSQKDTFVSLLEEEYKSSEYKDANVKVTSNDNTIVVTIDVDDKNFSVLDLEDSKENTYNAIKKDMESSGYTCK